MTESLEKLAVVPEPGDNCAVAVVDIPAGTQIMIPGEVRRLSERGTSESKPVTLPHLVMEGHRFVIAPIPAGEPLTSWLTPFATAVRDLAPGDYVCTEQSLGLLQERGVEGLPEVASAANVPLDPYQLDESALVIGEQVPPVDDPATFLGYDRGDGRVGTRNHIVICGVTSRGASFATALAKRFAGRETAGFDGVVAFAHTEAGEDTRPNNAEFVLSVLAGSVGHPNVAAILLVDTEGAALTSAEVLEHLRSNDYPAPHGIVETFTRSGSFAADLDRAAGIVEPWLSQVRAERTPQPAAALSLALQCGGSDAFSGLSANPLLGNVSAELIRHGGTAVIAETDELIGAEPYVLKNVRSAEVARAFVDRVNTFKERVSWHGHTAEGNPSGGNVYRGLYNIVLKSVGAARKLARQVRLDEVVDYGRPIRHGGYVFMDSPGNDLESVAGQIGCGCTMIHFTTGNGSITNFPFVPTMKYVTTTGRFELMNNEMDVNGGRYLDGEPMAELTAEVFAQTLEIASGTPSAGERTGQSQVSIWRNWRQTGPVEGVSISVDGRLARRTEDLPADLADRPLPGAPLPVSPAAAAALPPAPAVELALYRIDGRWASERIGLVLPTSLCSGQVGLGLSEQAEGWAGDAIDRACALPHTEGCGVSGGAVVDTYERIMLGHLLHPNVLLALLVEHGCEKTHNDWFRNAVLARGLDPTRFGWASIQLDGGIGQVTGKAEDWFTAAAAAVDSPDRQPAPLGALSLGLDARGPLRPGTVQALGILGGWIVTAGGTVVLPATSTLLADPEFRRVAFGSADPVEPTVAHGQQPAAPGWQVMRNPTQDWTETASGLAATGVQQVLVHVAGGTLTGERLVPVLQVTADSATEETCFGDLDGILTGDPTTQAGIALRLVADAASGRGRAAVLRTGNLGFQVTRGLLGTSM